VRNPAPPLTALPPFLDPLAEAAALFRDNKPAFDRNVKTSLAGGKVGATTFPKLL
jgi:hypothetical protein